MCKNILWIILSKGKLPSIFVQTAPLKLPKIAQATEHSSKHTLIPSELSFIALNKLQMWWSEEGMGLETFTCTYRPTDFNSFTF